MKVLDKSYYNSILSGTFSPCGNYFLAGNTYGDLQVFNVKNILQSVETETIEDVLKLSTNKFNFYSNSKTQINSLVTLESFLIAGISDEIYGWTWSNVLQSGSESATSKCSWKIQLPQGNMSASMKNELNCLKIGYQNDTSTDHVLYAGCNDKNVYSFSLEDGRLLRTFSGHSDYVHSVDVRDQLLISCGEDGTVRIWDTRARDTVNIINLEKYDELVRPRLGNWVGDVSLNEDWLVCGGGLRLSLWNLRTLDCPMTVFSKTKDTGIHICQFHQDKIVAGGSASCVSVLSYNDDLHTGIQATSSSIYGCAFTTEQSLNKVCCFFGNSNEIDVSTNFTYRDFVVPFY